jgi:hypothetical protein
MLQCNTGISYDFKNVSGTFVMSTGTRTGYIVFIGKYRYGALHNFRANRSTGAEFAGVSAQLSGGK